MLGIVHVAGAAIAAVRAGKFVAEDYGKYSTQRFGGASLAPLGTFEKKIPAALMAKVKAREKAILEGSFIVKVVETEPKSN